MDVSAMLSELSDHGFDDASDARMIEKLNTAYWDACGREPWPFLEKTISLTFTGSAVTASNFPTDFRAAVVLVTTAGSSPGTRLKQLRYEDWLQAYGTDTTTGVPLYYYFIGNTMNFFPKPEASTTITMMYLQQPAALADATVEASIVIPVPFQHAIVDGALFRLYAMEDDTDIAPTFETYFERALQNMREYCWRKSYDGNDTVHATDADDLGMDSSYYGFWSS